MRNAHVLCNPKVAAALLLFQLDRRPSIIIYYYLRSEEVLPIDRLKNGTYPYDE